MDNWYVLLAVHILLAKSLFTQWNNTWTKVFMKEVTLPLHKTTQFKLYKSTGHALLLVMWNTNQGQEAQILFHLLLLQTTQIQPRSQSRVRKLATELELRLHPLISLQCCSIQLLPWETFVIFDLTLELFTENWNLCLSSSSFIPSQGRNNISWWCHSYMTYSTGDWCKSSWGLKGHFYVLCFSPAEGDL